MVWCWICINIQLRFSLTASAFIINISHGGFLSPRPFLSSSYLSLPHLSCQLPLRASLCPFLFLHRKKEYKLPSKSEHDLNQTAGTMSHKQLSAFFHLHSDLHPSGSREIFGDGMWVEGESTTEVKTGSAQKRRAEEHLFTPPPFLCTVNHTEKGALLMACVGPWCRKDEMEKITAEMPFYWGYAGISLVGMEGRWETLCLSVCLCLIEVGRRTSGCSNIPPPSTSPPRRKKILLMINLQGIIFWEC